MKKILYLECSSGISGDMTVAALLDLGADRKKMDEALASLGVEGLHYHVSQQESYGIAGCDFDVHLPHSHSEHSHSHDHDSHSHEHEHEHHHHEHHHHGDEGHVHDHEHEHRNLTDVNAIIDRGNLTESARNLAKKIFLIVAQAESKAHGCPIEKVHFHEVGAIDSIADIVAAAVLLDDLGISECLVPSLAEGSGYVKCQHGVLPVPVPAVLNIAQTYKIPFCVTNINGEMVTPTGIAIAAAIRTSDRLPEIYQIEKIGIGLGKRDFGRANFLRAMILSIPENQKAKDQIYVIEANIDDSTGEMFGLAMEKIFTAGARDVQFMPCFMKKNRPGYLLRVIANGEKLAEVEMAIFESTTTIGLRKFLVERTCMQREMISVFLPFGEVIVKKCEFKDIIKFYPEYESVKALAEQTGISFQEIFNLAKSLAEAKYSHVGKA